MTPFSGPEFWVREVNPYYLTGKRAEVRANFSKRFFIEVRVHAVFFVVAFSGFGVGALGLYHPFQNHYTQECSYRNDSPWEFPL